MLGAVTDISYGILSVEPKFADGTPIENIEDAIILSGGQELKAWAAVAEYLDSMEDTDEDGIPDVPQSYEGVQGRKIVENSKAIGDLIKNPNRFAFLILAIVLLLLLLAALLVRFIVRLAGKTAARKRQHGTSHPH